MADIPANPVAENPLPDLPQLRKVHWERLALLVAVVLLVAGTALAAYLTHTHPRGCDPVGIDHQCQKPY